MGDRIRRIVSRLLKIMFRAALPGLLIYTVLLLSFVLHGTPNNVDFEPSVYLHLLIIDYLTALLVTIILEYRELQKAAVRVDEELIGNTFGGWRKPDKLFCEGMNYYMREDPRTALEHFLAVQEYELTQQEKGVLSFYIGRCYQLLDCPSNAVPYYDTAMQNGFPEHFARLFQARSYAESGDFDRSFRTYCVLLDNDPPAEFYFLYTDIGSLFLQQKMPEEAVRWFRKSIDQKQNYAFALSGMAIASLQQGEFAIAQDYRYKALLNRLKNPAQFRIYYDETRALMLEEHPEWAQRAAESDKKTEQRPGNSGTV